MAEHIDSIRSSAMPRVNKAEFYAQCRPGRVLFCEGNYEISRDIEAFTRSPFSHVATLLSFPFGRWGVLEATMHHGVHIGLLDYYVEKYNGDLAIAETPLLDGADVSALLETQFELIDDRYDVGQELSMVAHKLLRVYPIHVDRNEYFCSGLYEQGRKATRAPLLWKGPGMASPEQVWTDPSIVPVCALVKGRL
jgi:hypothetical protein